VEGTPIVEARGAQGEEVVGRLGDRLAEDFELDVTARGVQLLRGSVGCSKRIGEGPGGHAQSDLRLMDVPHAAAGWRRGFGDAQCSAVQKSSQRRVHGDACARAGQGGDSDSQ
jgi:hypothetical protein